MNFEFATAARIVFGAGSSAKIGAEAGAFGRRALFVAGSNSQRAERLLAELSAAGIDAKIFQAVGEPEIATVEDGVAEARKGNCDFVIGLGGGSVMDAAKAIAAMLTNDGELLDYLEIVGRGKSLAKPSAPCITLPTTAGTGAEVTRNSVLASPRHKVKVSLRSPFLLPRLAIIDPVLTYDLPPTLTAATGLDALTQLIEPYVCLRANPMTDEFCLEGIRHVARSLREAVFNGRNQTAREEMALASLLGGLSLANAGLGAVHGFAGPIGGSFPAPHGAVCAALLPLVMSANIRALRERQPDSPALPRYKKVAALLTGKADVPAEAGVEWVQQLVNELPIPKLRVFGLGENDISELVSKSANASSMKVNPITLTPDELAKTLRLAI